MSQIASLIACLRTVLPVTTNVGKESQMERLAQATIEISLADLKRVVEVNLNGVIYGSDYALRQFRQQPSGGVLINIASDTSEIGFPYYATYSATKHAVDGLSQALYQEMRVNRVKNIRICAIYPYATDTPWWQHAANTSGHTPRQKPMIPPEKVGDVIVKAVARPKKRLL